MKIYEFTVPELNYLREYCNFTSDQMALIDFRSKGMTLEQCAEEMNISISTAKRISQQVNRKIIKVC